VNPKNFFAELKRRNVYKVAVAYIVAGWALSQGIAQVFPVFDIPNWVIRLIVLLIIIGLPIALVLAWSFEITPQGIKRTEDVDLAAAAQQPKKRTWIYVVVIGGLFSIGLFFLGRGGAANDLLSISGEPNVTIMEAKALTCNIVPGRLPRGAAYLEWIERYAPQSGEPPNLHPEQPPPGAPTGVQIPCGHGQEGKSE
jgi:hypothetical protein